MNDWLASNLEILSTLGSALALYIFIRSAARRDIERLDKRVDKLEEKFEQLEAKMERGFTDIRQEIRQNRIESILYHGSYGEIKKTGTDK